MRNRTASDGVITCVALMFLTASPALAQKKVTPRAARVTTTTVTTTATAGRTSLPITFGSWLDDASTLAPGTASLSVSAGRWSARDGGQTDAPVFDLSAGVSKRVQLGLSVPFYHASYSDGFTSSGRGDIYATAKIKLVSADDHRVGLSMSPLIEVLSDVALSDTTLGLNRVNWALPVSVQAGTRTTQAFVTAGYFSRGATFAALGVTHAMSGTVTLSSSLTVSHSTKALSSTDLAGLSRSRADGTIGLSVMVSPRVGLSGNIGRTVSKLDQNGATFTASGAISVQFGHPRHP